MMGVCRVFRFAGVLSVAIVLIFPAFSYARRDALFLGLTDNRGEPVQEQLEMAIRHELSINSTFKLLGETETQRFIRERERLGHRRTEPFVHESAGLADSTIIIRGVVEEFRITPRRRWLLWGKLDASMTVKFHFNEVAGPAAYQGEFRGAASKPKEFLLFASAPKTIHISAVDRSELTGELQAQMIKELSEFTTLFFSSLTTGPIHQRAVEEGEEDFPGVSELMRDDD